MPENPLIDSPERFAETLQEFDEKLGDVVCEAEGGLQMMAFAYANKLLPAEIRIAAVKSIIKNNLKVDEGVTYMVVYHCMNHIQEIESQGAIKSLFSRGKNKETLKELSRLWEVIRPIWKLLEGTGRYEKFSENMLDFLSK